MLANHNEFIAGDGDYKEDEDEELSSRELELASSPKRSSSEFGQLSQSS